MKSLKRSSSWVFAAVVAIALMPGCSKLHIELPGFLKKIFDCECTCTCADTYSEGGGGATLTCGSKGNFATCQEACTFSSVGNHLICN